MCLAGPPPCRADHSRKNGRSLMKMNHEWTRINTNRPEDRCTSFNVKRHQMLLQFGALGVTMSWDDGFPGARASRPHQAWHSLGHLPHLDQPGTAPWLSFGLAAAVPAHRVAACSIALKLSGNQRNKYAGGTPALPGDKGQYAGGTPALPGDAAPAVRWGVSGGRLLRKPTCTLWETPVCPRAGPPSCRAVHSRKNGRSLMKMNHEWTRRDTTRQMDLLQPQAAPNASAIWCPWCDDVMG